LTYIRLIFMFLLMLTSFIVAAFCLFLYRSIFHGKVRSQWVFFSDVGLQHLVLLYHIVPRILFILKPEVLWF
jgi:NADH:ubiquinone oxidoreductase subunit 4 (subunit M)